MKRTCRGNNFKEAAQKEMKMLLEMEISWHGVPFERTNNQLINTVIFG